MYPTATPPLVLNERVPDPAVKILDTSFEKYELPLASVERLSQGYCWAEGAVYFGDARCLLWSDIPNNRIMRWDEETGATSVYRKPSNYANGNTRDRQGRLVTAEHGRRVTRTEYDGRITVLMDRFEGKRLNSPNDIVVKSDELDLVHRHECRHLTGNWNGETGEQELPQRVYRIDGKTGQATVATDGVVKRPNGLAFSPDEKKLYVIESSPARGRSMCSTWSMAAKLADGKKLIVCAKEETPDGFRVDVDGNLWCGWGMGTAELDGVRIFNPEGAADRPHQPAGALRQRLFRRAEAQPAVHGGVPFGLRALCEHARREGRMMAEALPAFWRSSTTPRPAARPSSRSGFSTSIWRSGSPCRASCSGGATRLSGTPRYFNFYLTQSADVLKSAAYLERLDQPTPMTRRSCPRSSRT